MSIFFVHFDQTYMEDVEKNSNKNICLYVCVCVGAGL